MLQSKSKGWLLLMIALCATSLCANDSTWEYAVQLRATIQKQPAQITLQWLQDSIAVPQSYTVYRKGLNETSWGPRTVLPGSSTSFIDTNVQVGTAYEYQVHKLASGYEGYGYLYSGIEIPMVEERGTVLLLVDAACSTNLAAELEGLQSDLTGDGWRVVRRDFSRDAAVTTVKSFIQAQYQADSNHVNTVFLFGHLPVPYSGNLAPDEHVQHMGAWPADVYYGNLLGPWTDSAVTATNGSDPRNWNIPGDGKFDQSSLTSLVKLMVGRVDLYDMPGQLTWDGAATFPAEIDLLRNYLQKDHRFRHGLMDVPRRGLIADFLGDADGDAYSASGWRNFSAFFGPDHITYQGAQGTWLSTLSSNAYLWAYGGGGGTPNGVNGLGLTGAYDQATTVDFMQADPKAVFFMLMGSWFGDWDCRDDLMRAVLATPTYGLACCWSGMPHWFCQHMALGETIGWSARRTQNNGTNGLYLNEFNAHARMVHIALMGDPTLRMHPVPSPSNLTAKCGSDTVTLDWAPSPDPAVLGYYVYRAASPDGPFNRLTSVPVAPGRFEDSTIVPGATYSYMVRALKLETSASGSYYNLSQGAFFSITNLQLGVTGLSAAVVSRGVVLTWDSLPGAVYRVCAADALSANWTNIQPTLTASGPSLSWTDLNVNATGQRFYQVFRVQ